MFKPSLLFAVVALAFVTGSHAGQITLTGVTITPYTGAGQAVNVVLSFTPQGSIVASTGTLIFTFPENYFSGTGSWTSTNTNINGMTGSQAATTSTSRTFNPGTNPTGTVPVVITLTGLSLGAAQAGGTFSVTSGVDAGTAAAGQAAAPAILPIMGVSTAVIGNNGANSPVWPVITFTPQATIPIGGTITITHPQGYFLGTATFPVGSVALMTGTATSAATATSTSIVITTAGAASGNSSAIVITLHGLTLGAARASGDLSFTSSATTGTFAPLAAAAILAAPVFTSLTWGVSGGYSIASTAVVVTLTFTPGAVLTAGTDTITITMPAGYFTGTGSFGAGNSSVAAMTGSVATTASGGTKFVITPAAANSLATAFTCTITGLSLGTAQAAGYFSLTTSTASTGSYGMVAPAINSIITSASITLATNVSGTNPSPVLAFTSTGTITAGGFVTIQMPAGYFLGTAAFVAGNASVGALTGSAPAVTSTSTSIVITTAAASITTSAFTVTLQGLTLGSAQAAGSFIVSTSVDQGFVTKTAPAIEAAPVIAGPPSPKASASVLNLSVALLLSIALALFI